MKEYIAYAKDRKEMIGETFGSMFLLGISGINKRSDYQFIRYISDRTVV